MFVFCYLTETQVMVKVQIQTGESVSDVGGERKVVTLTVLGLKHPAGHHLQVLDVGDDGRQLVTDTPRPHIIGQH